VSIRNYSNTAAQSTLTSNIGATDTAIALAGYAGDPTPPFTAALGRGTASEELVLVTAVIGSTVTVTRGYDGTSAQSQSAGTTFQEVVAALDFREANNHVNATGAVHGTSSQLVGVTDTQTLTNKTLTAPHVSDLTGTGTTTLAATVVTTLTVSGVSNLATVNVSGPLHVSGASTLASLTVTGAAAVPELELTQALLLDQQSADPATPAVAGQTALWKAADHGVYAVGPTAGKRRLTVHWGAGTTLPTAVASAGDTYLYTGLCLLRYNGSVWRQAEVCEVVSKAARDSLPTGPLYAGFRVLQTDNKWEWTYTGSTWRLSDVLGAAPKFSVSNAAWNAAGDAAAHTVTGYGAATDNASGLVAVNSSTGILTFTANARVSLTATFTSDSGSVRYSSVSLTAPPSAASGITSWSDYVVGDAGFAGGGSLVQTVGGTVNVVAGDAIHAITKASPVAVTYGVSLLINFV
jgi:hypothetical protein